MKSSEKILELELEEQLSSALALIAEQSQKIKDLEVALATALSSKNLKKTSQNSHLPSSKDLSSSVKII